MGFTGHQRDGESGLHHAQFRYLDSRNGRWTKRDPAGRVDGSNLYRYVRNNPQSLIDMGGTVAEVVDDGAHIIIRATIEFFRQIDPLHGVARPLPASYNWEADAGIFIDNIDEIWKGEVDGRQACLSSNGAQRTLKVNFQYVIGVPRTAYIASPDPTRNYFHVLGPSRLQDRAVRAGQDAFVFTGPGAVDKRTNIEAHELGHLFDLGDLRKPRGALMQSPGTTGMDDTGLSGAELEHLIQRWSNPSIKVNVFD